ncbi:MAG: HNH endonuclease [Bdellovibrionales bacterium]|nr:HNH endonuclease [Bdellovibrionales bacterium]
MPRRHHKKTKTSVTSFTQEIMKDPSLLYTKYSTSSFVAIAIAATVWILWRGLLRRRRRLSKNGYIVVDGQFEHRRIAQAVLGRKLRKGEVVHHINGKRTDNRESNLCVMRDYAHDEFHAWLRWKKEQDGRYPPPKYLRAVLRDRYQGILLRTLPNDLPPRDFDSESDRGGKAS